MGLSYKLYLLIKIFLVASLLSACGDSSNKDNSDGNVTTSRDFVAVSSGSSIFIYEMDDAGNALQISSASIPDTNNELSDKHTIFGLVTHPTKPIIYASSLIDRSWGDARIDKFSYDSDGLISYQGNAFTYVGDNVMDCQEYDSNADEYTETCAPTTLHFSSDASQLYVNEGNHLQVQVFAVDETTGDLTFSAEGADTYTHGLAISPDNNYLYNGLNIIELSDDVPLSINYSPTIGGNATIFTEGTNGENLLVTTLNNNFLAVYQLTTATTFEKIDLLNLDLNGAFYQDCTNDLSRFIVVGKEIITSVAFDGTTFSIQDQLIDEDITKEIMNRSVMLSEDGNSAMLASFYTNEDKVRVGQVSTYLIDEAGKLSLNQTIDFDKATRAILPIRIE